MASNVKYHQVS